MHYYIGILKFNIIIFLLCLVSAQQFLSFFQTIKIEPRRSTALTKIVPIFSGYFILILLELPVNRHFVKIPFV